jgi:fructokinase
MKKILAIGEVVWDVLPTGKKLGGAPVNFAYFAQALGAYSLPATAIGADALGDETLEALKLTGLDLSLLQRNDLPTSRVLVTTDAAGVPQYEIVEGVAWDAIACDERILAAFRDADVVCWGSLAQRSPASRRSILQMLDAAPAGCLKVFDINLRQSFYSREVVEASLLRADIPKLNEDELPVVASLFGLSGDTPSVIASLIAKFGLREIIFTEGAVQSSVYDASGLVSRIPTPKVEVTDTVGAGDSFTAAYIIGRLNGLSVRDAHSKAVEVSAWTCTQAGAINPLPENLKF